MKPYKVFIDENDFRSYVIKKIKKYENLVYPLENYIGSGIPDILIICNDKNILLELKLENYKLSLLQEYICKKNKDIHVIRYKKGKLYYKDTVTCLNELENILRSILYV